MVATIKNIRRTFIIAPTCRERFLDAKRPCGRALRDRGVTLCGISDLSSEYEVGRVDPAFHLVLYTLGGAGALRTASGTRALNPGDRLFAPAHTAYGYALGASRWKIVWFHLADGAERRALREQDLSVRASAAAARLEAAMEGYLAESVRDEGDSQRAATLFAELIGVYLDRELDAGGDPRAREMRNRLYALWDRVHANLARDWSVADLARELHTSPVNFHRIATRFGGVRPMEMVVRLRMRRAQDLLRTTDLPVRRIAEFVGYRNAFAFSAAFKRETGVGPREFRRSRAG